MCIISGATDRIIICSWVTLMSFIINRFLFNQLFSKEEKKSIGSSDMSGGRKKRRSSVRIQLRPAIYWSTSCFEKEADESEDVAPDIKEMGYTSIKE